MELRSVENWTQGRWWSATRGAGDSVVVSDAATGAPLASVSSQGLDPQAVLDYARATGIQSLQDLNFQSRAALVKSLALAMKERRQELVALSLHTGATSSDASVDIDGAIGTALVFASQALKALPATNHLAEDAVEPLGRGGTFGGRHLLTPRHGVSVQINAYNFPVWGMVEKLTPSLIAGVPSIVKPATPTAYVAEHAVRILDESGLLPVGALQLVCGSLGNMMDLLDGQDLVSFTGSAGTAALLRRSASVTERSVRFNAEADSLNACVLGLDVSTDDDEYELFLRSVVHEMTCKTGQRCTAIRRVLVPEGRVREVSSDLAARLSSIRIGNPANESVEMGPLASITQRESVAAAVDLIAQSADLILGGAAPDFAVDADVAAGAYFSPTLLLARDRWAPQVHEIEAFGPVATIIPYTDTEQAVDLLRLGGGSLVASVVTGDYAFARQLLTGAGSYHGRILVLDRECSAESTGHGTPMPQLVHGGPGRAGGGEEEGGLRAIHHYLQRTAIQGSPEFLGALASDA